MGSTQDAVKEIEFSNEIWKRLMNELRTLKEGHSKTPLFKFEWGNRSTQERRSAEIVLSGDAEDLVLEIRGGTSSKSKTDNLVLSSAKSVLAPNTNHIGPRFPSGTTFKTRNIINFFDFDFGVRKLSLCPQPIPKVSPTGAELALDFEKKLLNGWYSQSKAKKEGRAFHA